MSSNPVVLVTGASKGIGLATAHILTSKFRAKIVTFSRSISPELQELKDSVPKQVSVCQGDVASLEDATAAVELAVSTYGRLDAIIFNAGTMHPVGRIHSSAAPAETVATWKALFEVNFFSQVQTLQIAVPHLRASKGKIIFVSSGAAVGGMGGWGPYSASKAAVNSLCRTLANEEPDITAVALRPGVVDTGMQTEIRSIGPGHMLPHELERFTELFLSGRLLRPEDPAHVIASLALNADKSLSGKFVNWDEEALQAHREPA